MEGRESTVKLLADETQSHLKAESEFIGGEDSKSWWKQFTEQEAAATDGSEVVIRASTRPRSGHELVEKLVRIYGELGGVIKHLSWSLALGTTTARIAFQRLDNAPVRLRQLRDQCMSVADNVTVLAAPREWKADIDVWGSTPETIDVMRALKEQFDPNRVLNPGRFVGRI
jgi:glycolate oxidase FAD binding subunit